MGTNESLHDLIDTLSEDDAGELWDYARTRFAEPEPLTDDDMESIKRGLEDARAGRVYTTEEVLRHILKR